MCCFKTKMFSFSSFFKCFYPFPFFSSHLLINDSLSKLYSMSFLGPRAILQYFNQFFFFRNVRGFLKLHFTFWGRHLLNVNWSCLLILLKFLPLLIESLCIFGWRNVFKLIKKMLFEILSCLFGEMSQIINNFFLCWYIFFSNSSLIV